MNWYKKANESIMTNFPTTSEIVGTLKNHPLVKNIGRVKDAYVVGSFSTGKQNPQSDIDVLLEIYPIKNISAEEFEEKKRDRLRNYFVKNNITGIQDSIHPQWNGRRIDIYFTYDASTETRPKIKLPWVRKI